MEREFLRMFLLDPMDNMSFHYETSAQNWKYFFQRSIAAKREKKRQVKKLLITKKSWMLLD